MDDAWLDSLPDGSVGAAYRHFIRTEQISAEGLIEISRQGAAHVDEPHPYAWMGRRTRDVHDIWHILSGYHRDGLGEACLVAFSYAQTGGLGWALIAPGAALAGPQGQDLSLREGDLAGLPARQGRQVAAGRGLRAADGRAAGERARRRLNITPATIYDAIPPEARDQSLPKAA